MFHVFGHIRNDQGGTCNIHLSDLIDRFIQDDFAKFLDDKVRNWRNNIAHGRLDDNTEEIANITFCALAAFITDYDKYREV